MGLCGSGEQKVESDRINDALAKARAADFAVKKLLLLGAGESGKSTLFKQMRTIYGKGFSADDRKEFKTAVHDNVVNVACILADEANNFSKPETPEGLAAQAVLFNESLTQADTRTLTPELAQHIAALWADPGIRKTYDSRAQFQLYDSAAYFLDQVLEVCKPDYVPTEADVLRVRIRTTGIHEEKFRIANVDFVMFDVGGQRNERRKWIHCFEGVTAVIFVAALSAYDQMLFEDSEVNRIMEALTLFGDICNSDWFLDTSMILFLNKSDLFREKIQRVSIGEFMSDYSGPDKNYEAGLDFLRQKFLHQKHREDGSESSAIYTHVTCATDTKQVNVVFNAVKDIVIQHDLQYAGLN
jgi:GTPase SAR1 family protein